MTPDSTTGIGGNIQIFGGITGGHIEKFTRVITEIAKKKTDLKNTLNAPGVAPDIWCICCSDIFFDI